MIRILSAIIAMAHWFKESLKLCLNLFHLFEELIRGIGLKVAYENTHLQLKARGGGYMTCGWTGVCRPVFRKVPSSDYRNLLSHPLL